MGADKNSSLKRELDLYPKYTTKDSHTSLPRSRSHYGRTNPRNKPQTIPKRKHEARSKGLSNPVLCWADGPRAWGGHSADTRRMVLYLRAEGPRTPGRRSATHERTVRYSQQNDPTRTPTRRRSIPRPRTVREQLVPRGRSATSRWMVRQTPSSQKHLANRIETKAHKNTR
jgi:hypothetical protein